MTSVKLDRQILKKLGCRLASHSSLIFDIISKGGSYLNGYCSRRRS